MKIDFDKIQVSAQPQVITAILKLNKEDVDMSFKDLEKIIKSDQNIATLILKVSNSPFYTRGNTITTLDHAIGILGFKLVHNICLMLSTKSIFAAGNYARFKRLVWEHSVITGILARDLAKRLKKENLGEECFVAGLLHDIGKAVLNVVDRKKFIEVIDIATGEDLPFAEAEERVFETDHMKVGLQAATEWKLPEFFVPVIGYHERISAYKETDQKEKEVFYMVSYANAMANIIGFGHKIPAFENTANYLEEQLKIDEQTKRFYLEKYRDEIKKDDLYQSFMSIS